MNHNHHSSKDADFHIPIFPEDASYQARRRRWLLWPNKNHSRHVRVRPTRKPDGIFSAEYSDHEKRIEFFDHASAEHYLKAVIPVPSYEGQILAKKIRDVQIHFICKECGYLGCVKMEVTFEGPFNMVTAETVTTTAAFPCTNCGKNIPDAEVSTRPCADQHRNSDCEWNELPT